MHTGDWPKTAEDALAVQERLRDRVELSCRGGVLTGWPAFDSAQLPTAGKRGESDVRGSRALR